MLSNQRGAVLPIMMIVAAAFLIVTYFAMEQFVIEKKFYHETEEKLIADHLFVLAVKDLQSLFSYEDYEPANGTFSYLNGTVRYTHLQSEEELFRVMLYASTNDRLTLEASAVYDTNLNRMIEWKEK
jgi:competence protein ComGG